MNNKKQLLNTFAFVLMLCVAPFISIVHASDINKKIEDYVQSFYDVGQFNGTVLVSKNGKRIFSSGYGYANFEWEIKNTPETKFRIGSITKQFTAMLIMQLVEEGKINLDDSISKHIPDYRKDIGEKVTIHHLLTHTSGIPSYTALPDFGSVSMKKYSVDDFTKEFCSHDLAFEPGTKFSYNNSGYFLLGNIIEKVTNKSYADALAEKIFIPLGMKNSGYDLHQTILKHRAGAYSAGLAGVTNAAYLDMSLPYAAGSMYSNVNDLMIWDKALHEYALITKASTEKMYQPTALKNYAYGWSIDELPAEEYGKTLKNISHGGGINGFNTYISRLMDDKYLIVLLNNTGGAPLGEMSKGITKILYNKSYTKAQPTPDKHLYSLMKNEGLQAATSEYENLIKQGKPMSERRLNAFGYALMALEMYKEAIAMLSFNVKAHSESSNAYDSLAEAYLLDGNKQQALVHYQTSYDLDNSNSNAKNQIELLK